MPATKEEARLVYLKHGSRATRSNRGGAVSGSAKRKKSQSTGGGASGRARVTKDAAGKGRQQTIVEVMRNKSARVDMTLVAANAEANKQRDVIDPPAPKPPDQRHGSLPSENLTVFPTASIQSKPKDFSDTLTKAWTCETCTFINTKLLAPVCQICLRPRKRQVDDKNVISLC